MNESLKLTLCETQAQLFVLSRERGFSSDTFIKAFMHSDIAKDLDNGCEDRYRDSHWHPEKQKPLLPYIHRVPKNKASGAKCSDGSVPVLFS